MSGIEVSALERGREAYEDRAWALAFDELASADTADSLAAEDLERLGEAARWSRHFDQMLDTFERAAAAYESAGDRRSAARVDVKLAQEHYVRRGDALAAGWLARAERLLEDEPACHERGLVLMCYAQALFFAGDGDGTERISQQMIELGRELGDPDIDAAGRLALGHARLLAGRIGEGTALIDEAMAAALGGGLELWTTGQIFCSTIVACRNRGDLARASEWSVAALRWCERQSVSGFPGLCRLHRAEVMRLRGDLDRAERDARDAVDELLDAGPRWAAWALHELGEICRRRGDRAQALQCFRRSAELGFDPQPGLALLRLQEGKPSAARRAICEHLAEGDGLAREGRWLVLPAAVQIAVAAGDEVLARSAVAELEKLAEAQGTSAVRAAASVARGRIALVESRFDEAIRDLRLGVRLWSELDAPYEVAEARELMAQAYSELGDPDAAELELTSAHASLERMGAVQEARRIVALASGLGTAPVTAVRTFMFTDIVGSSQLVEMLGDEHWESLLAWHDRTLRACFESAAGEEIKHEGDGFFVAFADADSALACACAIQRSLRDHRRDHGFAPRVRIGVHTAEVTDRGGDYVGRGVHATARIAAAAGGGEIIASATALDNVNHPLAVTEERSLTLKGLAEPVAVATVDWSEG